MMWFPRYFVKYPATLYASVICILIGTGPEELSRKCYDISHITYNNAYRSTSNNQAKHNLQWQRDDSSSVSVWVR